VRSKLPTSAWIPDVTEANWTELEQKIGFSLTPERRSLIEAAILEFAFRTSERPLTYAAAADLQRREAIERFGLIINKREQRKSKAGRPDGSADPHLDALILAIIEAATINTASLGAEPPPTKAQLVRFLKSALLIGGAIRSGTNDAALRQRVSRLLEHK
jgi:hypothetical protein